MALWKRANDFPNTPFLLRNPVFMWFSYLSPLATTAIYRSVTRLAIEGKTRAFAYPPNLRLDAPPLPSHAPRPIFSLLKSFLDTPMDETENPPIHDQIPLPFLSQIW